MKKQLFVGLLAGVVLTAGMYVAPVSALAQDPDSPTLEECLGAADAASSLMAQGNPLGFEMADYLLGGFSGCGDFLEPSDFRWPLAS